MSDTNPENGLLEVEVVYASPERQRLLSLRVPLGTTALEAVRRSGILQEFAEIDISKASFGIFSKLLDGRSNSTAAEYLLQPRDRVEIYRPLLIDPMQARLRRAARPKKGK
jgi:putative ubiquitin-RnfH superfamily antitoxin RatB of RatAB toxin-antitoxin module